MLPSRFEYHRPDSLEEAMHLLDEHGDEAKVLAGGQSLNPVMKLRLAAPTHLIDIGRLGLDSIAEADGRLTIGALTRHRDLERSDLLKARYPVMAAAAPLGLDLGKIAHEEIAVAILAELVQECAAGELAAASPAEVPTHEAIDPVCGTTVDVASAVYRSTFEDTTYYFCSAGCLTRFEEDPARFAATVPG